MPKFAGSKTPTRAAPGPVRTTTSTVTHEGAPAYGLDAKGELFTLTIVNLVEPTFYESDASRQARFVSLINQVTKEDPEWVAGLASYARKTMQMRSAPIVIACEYVQAGGPNGRRVIDSVCVRADEPAEVLAYWRANYGRQTPQPIKRGVADAARRLYTQRNALKFDSSNSGMRMADVIDITHPSPADHIQSALFRHLLDKRHNRDAVYMEGLDEIAEVNAWVADEAPLNRIPALITWERLSTYRKMDAAAWEAVIPKMGAMALVRNLRNFDQAGISSATQAKVVGKLMDAEEIRKSRQLPFRFYTAWREVNSLTYGGALEMALGHSTVNVPVLDGRTMVLIDMSASMSASISQRGTIQRWEIGAVFAGVMAKMNPGTKVVGFGQNNAVLHTSQVGDDVLRIVEKVGQVLKSGQLGHATYLWSAIENHYDGEDRVVVFTDDQAHDRPGPKSNSIPNIYTFDLAGYGRSGLDLNAPGRYRLGGFSDACFKMMELLEKGRRADWPWATNG